MARLSRFGILATLATSALLLSACGAGTAVADARASCVFVGKAIALEHQSQQVGLDAAKRTLLQSQALNEILQAQPDAANATSADGMWNPLQTTIEEANRVPLHFELPALARICQVANSSSPYL